MTFRTRILLACLFVALVPLLVFVAGARREVRARLAAGFEARVAASSDVVRQDLSRQAASIDARLLALAQRIVEEPAPRAALLRRADRTALIDLAPGFMPIAGLDLLLLLDADGAILGSGHFRADYERRFRGLPAMQSATGPALVAARRPDGAFVALARAHTFTLAGERFAIVGGIEIDRAFIRSVARDTADLLTVSLAWPGGMIASRDAVAPAGPEGFAEQIELPFLDDAGGGAGADVDATARWTITHSLAPLHDAGRAMDLWFLAAAAAAVLVAVIFARILAGRVNRPLEELARRSMRIHLERLDSSFATRRRDEVGTLSRMLDTMVQRLRSSAARLRDAERRATVGDMARQVNHDIRNGLLPIRNVISHLSEVARESPDRLLTVFEERESTLRGGVGYLESLAASYARLTPRTERRRLDLNDVVRDAAGDAGPRVTLRLDARPLAVEADPVALRRIIENLTVNAVESLPDGRGSVTISTMSGSGDSDGRVIVTVTDTGTGIEPDALDRIFNDFYTTKEHGSGLGLSIVRRLVADMGGRVAVDSRPGTGTTFRVELPAADTMPMEAQ